MTGTITLEPVVKSVHVQCSIEHAFEVFTRHLASWWPLESHARHAGEVRQIIWEEHEGGEVFETATNGEKAHWATVLAWEPPTGFTLAWKVDPTALAPTEVEVRFEADAGGTRVLLEHRHWDRLGETGVSRRANYETGWDTVLACLVAHLG